MRKTVVILSVCLTSLSSCYYDVEDQLYPPVGSCDSSAVTYSGTVAPVLQSNGCTSCHSGGAPSGNISLASYSDVRIVAQNGRLYGAISHTAGFAPMPQGGNKMSDCTINKIKAWIDAGAPNN
jgi:hypothetical protein